MSGKLMGQVYERVLDHAEASVLLAMADHSSDDGSRCFPSIALLAWKTNYSERHVIRIVGRLQQIGVLLPVQHKGGGRGFATEYQIVLSALPEKPAYRVRDTELDPALTVATIARFFETCQGCKRSGQDGLGPDQRPWKIVLKVPSTEGGRYTTENVALSCLGCAQIGLGGKGDILSSEGKGDIPGENPDSLDPKGDTLSSEEPGMSGKGDTTMSPQPLVTVNRTPMETPMEPLVGPGPSPEPSNLHLKGEPLIEIYPTWFHPIIGLHGFKNRDHRKFITLVEDTCSQPEVKATPAEITASFVAYYQVQRIAQGWTDPVASFRNTMGREIKKVTRMSENERSALTRDVGRVKFLPINVPDESVDQVCVLCHGHGYYLVEEDEGRPAWCDHKGGRRTTVVYPDLDVSKVWDQVLESMMRVLPGPTYKTWFEPSRLLGFDRGHALVQVQNQAAVDMINRRLYQSIQRALHQAVPPALMFEVVFVWGEDATPD